MPKPTIRAARFGDIPAIFALMQEAHARSAYAERTTMNEKAAKALLMTSIQRHGGTSAGATFVAVADAGERIEGFILATLQRFYLVLDLVEAQDLYWYAAPGAHAGTAGRLLRAMHRWVPKGAIIRHGVADGISEARRVGGVLARRGFRECGAIYEKDTGK